jgi:hypothetical protein
MRRFSASYLILTRNDEDNALDHPRSMVAAYFLRTWLAMTDFQTDVLNVGRASRTMLDGILGDPPRPLELDSEVSVVLTLYVRSIWHIYAAEHIKSNGGVAESAYKANHPTIKIMGLLVPRSLVFPQNHASARTPAAFSFTKLREVTLACAYQKESINVPLPGYSPPSR